MTSGDDKPLYNIDDEADRPLYSIEEDSDIESDIDEDDDNDGSPDPEPEQPKRLSPLQVLFKTMLTPVEGWKALRRARFKSDEVASRCFYPLIALAAVSDVAAMFYEAHVTFTDWAIDGLITFITFFFGYFTVLLVGGVILPRKSRFIVKEEVGKQLVMISMSTLALFWVFIQLLPMIEPVLVFLPLWTIYLIYKGVRVYRVKDEAVNSTTGLLCMLVIGAPLFWNWLFSEFLL